ncbi:hypothetical protein PA27867_2646 [Cryobacterium arcticum]|uniref:Uncharacterized protein n=2 Tax=Cryobacterium arcticum TaxID=670052 RepID=A0A1B1BLQ2_9MICO|nr:hypothetical protein PA27867_2646 [Cryobacterium arcticum]
MARPYLRRARRSASLGVIALLGGIVVTTAGVLQPVLPPLFSPIEQSPVLRVLAGGLILAALLQLTQARASSRRIQDALLVNVREGAERVRIQSDREHYEQYLRSNGDD